MKKLWILLLTAVIAISAMHFACAESTEPQPNKGLERISISVSDLSSIREFFENNMELSFVAEGELSREEVSALYNMDATAKYVMLKNDVQTTLLELLEFDPKPTKTARAGYNPWDFGYFDISFRSRSNDEAFETFTDLGYTFSCPPYRYTTTWSGAEVLEAVMIGPDDIPLAMIEKTANTPAFEGMFRNFPDMVLVAEDVDETDRYYVDTIGLSKVFDMVLDDGLVDSIFGVENGVHTRIVMYMGSGATPVVEIIEFTNKKGVSMTAEGASVPQNAGTFAMCFEVDDLDAAIATHQENDFKPLSDVVEMELAPYGKIRSALVSGPSDALTELFEIVR